MQPSDPLQAVTHPDPYPYYAQLARARPLYQDAALGLWVASAPGIVRAVLDHEAACVRPASEPVPSTVCGNAAGLMFGRFVRMRDDALHRDLKPLLAECLQALGGYADTCWPAAPRSSAELNAFLFDAPVYAMAQRLGLPASAAPACARAVRQFRAALMPDAGTDERETGRNGASWLQDVMVEHLQAQHDHAPLGRLRGQAARFNVSPAEVAANLAGLLFQSCEAGAGLIGNTLLRLGRDLHGAAPAIRDVSVCILAAAQTARHDPPVHNTRRYLQAPVSIEGHALPAGACVLLVLAAAGMCSADDTPCTYGLGRHACPGLAPSLQVAGRAVHYLLEAGLEPATLLPRLAYWPLPNARVPCFGASPRRPAQKPGHLPG